MKPTIVLTPGEPAGIGPDITVQLAFQSEANLIVVADKDLLLERAKKLQLPLTVSEYSDAQPIIAKKNHLVVLPVSLKEPVEPGLLNKANAPYVIRSLELATDFCLQKKAAALVTGPVHKGILNDAGIPFTGHTEFLATRCQASRVVMLFVSPKIKMALVTTHLPLKDVPSAISKEKIQTLIRLLHVELQTKWGLLTPRILVAGLNPHAGEKGYLGREEMDIIQPALSQLREENIHVAGPLPADTLFTPTYLSKADVIVAMYHDQALPVVKHMDLGNTVNVTLGLPIIRTSVDHGTALDVAGTLKADPSSLKAALTLAIQLAKKCYHP